MCPLNNVQAVPTWTPAVRAFTELHPANSSCIPGNMRSHGSSVLFLTTVVPENPKASSTGPDTDVSWGSSDQLVDFHWVVTGSCENPLPCAWKRHGDRLQHCQNRGYLWHIEHPTALKEIVHNHSASLVPSAAYSPEETALSVLSLELVGESRRQLLQSFILGEGSRSYCSARAGAEVGD